MNRKALIKYLREIAKIYEVKVKFSSVVEMSTLNNEDSFTVKADESNSEIINAFFHELGHVRQVREFNIPPFFEQSDTYTFVLSVEQQADQFAKEFMEFWTPGVKAQMIYSRKWAKEQLFDYYFGINVMWEELND